jgi:hypothetical protein
VQRSWKLLRCLRSSSGRGSALTNHSSEKVWEWVKRLGSLLGVLLILVGILRYVISSELEGKLNPVTQRIDRDVADLRAQITGLSTKIEDMDRRQDRLETRAIPALLTAPLPKSANLLRADLEEKAELAIAAKKNQISVDPREIASTGKQILEIGAKNPDLTDVSWQTVGAFLDYRSFLNMKFAPQLSNLTQLADSATPILDLRFTPLPPPSNSKLNVIPAFMFWAHGVAPPNDRAMVYRISKPIKSGGDYQFFLFDGYGGTIVVDDQGMRNIIIKNSVIEYDGGSVILQNVYFVNCTFKFTRTPTSESLGASILASTATNFSAPKST